MSVLYNIHIDKDTSYSEKFVFYSDKCRTTTMDLSGYSFKAEAKVDYEDENPVFEFTIDTIDASEGSLYLSLSSTETEALTAGTYLWDLRVIDTDSIVDRWIKGNVTVSGTVTRE